MENENQRKLKMDTLIKQSTEVKLILTKIPGL